MTKLELLALVNRLETLKGQLETEVQILQEFQEDHDRQTEDLFNSEAIDEDTYEKASDLLQSLSDSLDTEAIDNLSDLINATQEMAESLPTE